MKSDAFISPGLLREQQPNTRSSRRHTAIELGRRAARLDALDGRDRRGTAACRGRLDGQLHQAGRTGDGDRQPNAYRVSENVLLCGSSGQTAPSCSTWANSVGEQLKRSADSVRSKESAEVACAAAMPRVSSVCKTIPSSWHASFRPGRCWLRVAASRWRRWTTRRKPDIQPAAHVIVGALRLMPDVDSPTVIADDFTGHAR